MKTIVTGGAGFIGSNLVDRLINDGHSVTVIDNLSVGKESFFEHHKKNSRFTFVKADVEDAGALKHIVRGHDTIYHLAANSDISKGASQVDIDFRVTVNGTFNLLMAMKEHGIQHLIYTSGSGVYGSVPGICCHEDYGPLTPVSLYGASKLSAESFISAFCHMFHIQAWVLRPANIVGPRITHGAAFDFVKRLKENPKALHILGNGKQRRSYIHVDDVIDAMLVMQNNAHGPYAVCNVATDDTIDVTDVANIVIKEMGLSDVQLSYAGGEVGWTGDVKSVELDITKLKKLGWKPKYTSSDATRETVRYLLKT